MEKYDYKTILNHIKKLCNELKLIEIVEEKVEKIAGMKTKYKKPYRLSLNGIFYLILNTFNIQFGDFILSLLENYRNNILFKLFLYPLIQIRTMLDIEDDHAFFSIVVLYLRNICGIIIDYIGRLKNMGFTTDDGYIIEQVFIWPNNESYIKSDFSTVNLRYVLKNILKWNWIDHANITPKFDEDVIEIRNINNPQNNSIIIIQRSENKAVLRQQGRKVEEFSINSNDHFLSIETKTDRKSIDSMEISFIAGCKEQLFDFLNKLKTQITSYNPSFDILSNDENFKKALKYLESESKLK